MSNVSFLNCQYLDPKKFCCSPMTLHDILNNLQWSRESRDFYASLKWSLVEIIILNTAILDTLAKKYMTSKSVLFSCGMSQSLTTAVIIVMEWSTKLTLSWTPSTMRTTVRQQRLQSAGFCQANKVLDMAH